LPRRRRPRASRSRAAARGVGSPHGHDQARACARRREPQERPGRSRRACSPRRRMRLVRRPCLRPRLLSEPHAAEMPLAATRSRRLPRLLRCAGENLSCRRSLGTARRNRSAGGGTGAGPFPRSRRWQIAGRVSDRGGTEGARPPRGATADRNAAHASCRYPRRLGAGDGGLSHTTIASVRGRRVWDSRGRPTVEAEIRLAHGASARATAPGGASTGWGEALDLRDGGAARGGFGVTRAVGAVNEIIAPALAGLDAGEQSALDANLAALDGTPA